MTANEHNTADKILYNARVVTVDNDFSIKEAVAIRDGKFTGVGSNREIQELAGMNSEIMDMGGKTVIPGLIDGHAHMDREGLQFLYPSLNGKRSIEDILDVIREEVKKKRPSEWVITMPIGDGIVGYVAKTGEL